MASFDSPNRRAWTAALALAALVACAFALSVRGDFLWDDDLHITANPTIIGPLGLKEIWTSARANYFPLVLTNFWVQHALWGVNPVGYHVVTIACHALAAVLLWRVLLALRVRGAWWGAALWALHPVQVESVAWICELKNTQSAVFFLAAAWCWIRWLEEGLALPAIRESNKVPSAGVPHVGRYYALALVAGVLALLSKPSTVMLPVALALCAWWVRRKLHWRDIVALAPFLALSALAAGWTIWEQKHHSGAIGAAWSQTLPERCAIAGRVVWFYLGKLAWPQPLMFIYPRWQIDARSALAYVPAFLALGALVVLWLRRAGRAAPVLFASAYFVALLFPVLGFFSVYFFRYSFVGDHFQYLASMGPLALGGAGISGAAGWLRARGAGGFGVGLPVALVLSQAVVTAHQCRVYRNNEALWRDTLAKNPATPMAWLNLADTFAQQQRYEESLATYRHALELTPEDPDGWNDLGNVLVLLGRPEEAARHFERALALKPDFPEAHSNYGNALRALGRSGEAIEHYRRALALKPEHVEALNNLGAELAENGHPQEALPQFKEALRLQPRHAGAHDNLGIALRALGRIDDAIAQHRQALEIQPNYPEAEANLARTLFVAGRATEALPHFERALALKPAFAGARGSYAMALAALGRGGEAFAQLERAVELAPNSAEAQHNLGTALAQSGRVEEAVAHFETAVRLAPQFTLARLSLATALGSKGRWTEAIPHLRAVLAHDPNDGRALSQLAVVLVNSEQLSEAVPVFEQALRVSPRSAELHDNFAQLLRVLGRTREAFEHFERAADLRRGR